MASFQKKKSFGGRGLDPYGRKKVIEILTFFYLLTMKHRDKNCISSLSKGREKITNERDISNEMVPFFLLFLLLT